MPRSSIFDNPSGSKPSSPAKVPSSYFITQFISIYYVFLHKILGVRTLTGFNKNGNDLLRSAAITIELLFETGADINAILDPIKHATTTVDNLPINYKVWFKILQL